MKLRKGRKVHFKLAIGSPSLFLGVIETVGRNICWIKPLMVKGKPISEKIHTIFSIDRKLIEL